MNEVSKIVYIADKFASLLMKMSEEEDECLYKAVFEFYYNLLFKYTNSTVQNIHENISLLDDLL